MAARVVMLVAATAALAASPAAAPGARDADTRLCVDLINQKRATLGLPALARWRDGEALAASDAADDGRTRIRHGAYRRRIAAGVRETSAQNECLNTDTRAGEMIRTCIDDMWAEGPERPDGKEHGHYVNMTSPRYAKVACGFAIAPDGSLWSVQNFITDRALTAKRSPDPDRAGFDRACVGAINRLRATSQLPPYAAWPGGADCAARLAAIEARGGQPGRADEACLGSAWASRSCSGSDDTAAATLDACVRHEWSRARDDLGSRTYRQAACALARKGDGTATIVQVFH